jgi:hypothetical protein
MSTLQMTPEEWKIWKRINARPAKALAAYPDLERQDFDETLDQTAAAAALRPMPVVVLTASDKFIDVVPKLIQAGELPPDTAPDFGAVVDRANSAAQNQLAALVPGAVHITDTHSGHNIMIDNAPVVRLYPHHHLPHAQRWDDVQGPRPKSLRSPFQRPAKKSSSQTLGRPWLRR